ncbi:MAG: hypothetical protein ABFE01_09025 [Phycisphaerales bacterium]
MNVTTGCRGRITGQGGRLQAVGCRQRPSGLRPAVYSLFLVLCPLVLLSGCDKAAVEKAQQEAREAKTAVQQLKHSLALAEKEIANAKAELAAVQQSRDQLQGQIDTAGKERDEALAVAQKAQEALAQSSGRVSATAALQKQVDELNALVAEQRKQIEELQKQAAEPAVAVPAQPTPAEPNQG